MKKNQRGFTLIELLLVVAIIGILAAVAIPRFNPNQDDAKIAKIKATLENLETAAELYRIEEGGSYPSDIATMTGTGQLKRAPIDQFGGDYSLIADGVAQFSDLETPANTVTLASDDTAFGNLVLE